MPGEVVVKPVVEELEREVVLTQRHLTLQKELNVMDRLVIDVTLTIVMVSTTIYKAVAMKGLTLSLLHLPLHLAFQI